MSFTIELRGLSPHQVKLVKSEVGMQFCDSQFGRKFHFADCDGECHQLSKPTMTLVDVMGQTTKEIGIIHARLELAAKSLRVRISGLELELHKAETG